MGFLEKLQDIGIGSRGPLGRMESGAQRLTQTLDRVNTNFTEKGINKAIIAATKNGKQITPQEQVKMSERWGVPLQEVMRRVKPINQQAEARELEQMGKTFYGFFHNYQKNKKKGFKEGELTQELVMEWARLSGAKTMDQVAFLMGSVQKFQPQRRAMAVGKGQDVVEFRKDPIGGGPSEVEVIHEGKTPPGEKKETPAEKDARLFELFKKKERFKAGMEGSGSKNREAEDARLFELFKKKERFKAKLKKERPENYWENVNLGLEAIEKDAVPTTVYNELKKAYPGQHKELKSILEVQALSAEAKKALQKAVDDIDRGDDKHKVFRTLATDYPEYRKIFKEILLTRGADDALAAIAMLFNK